jgi:glycerophosphoryl diester phosphodiesterase
MAHVAHRGGPGDEGVENTLATFQETCKLKNVDAIELDVRLTRDRVIVISHDDRLSRMGDERKVSELNYDELPLLHGREKICRLVDLLDDPGCNLPIELDFKVSNDDMIAEVYNLFRNRNRLDKLIWGSFSDATRTRLQLLYPEVPCFCALMETVKMYVGFMLGLLPFMELRSNLLCTVLIREEWLSEFVRMRHSFPLSVVVKLLPLLGPGFFTHIIENSFFVSHVLQRGMSVVFWTCNTHEDMQRVRRSGASGIITDFPKRNLLHAK